MTHARQKKGRLPLTRSGTVPLRWGAVDSKRADWTAGQLHVSLSRDLAHIPIHPRGIPLGSTLRRELESTFGASLADVRLHTDAAAAQAASALRAQAFTWGKAIWFNSGAFDPASRPGRYLIAHEVAHALQTPAMSRQPVGAVPLGRPTDPAEVAAHRAALGFLRGERVAVAATETPAVRRQEAAPPPTYWFEDPEGQRAGRDSPGGRILSTQEEHAQLVVETPGQVGNVFVRFAYSAMEVSGRRTSSRVQGAKRQILEALAQILADLDSVPDAANQQQRRRDEEVRAQLHEALSGFTRSSPLNIFIATEPTPAELRSGHVAANTANVYVRLADLHHPDRLQAAIRVPLIMLTGGGPHQVPPISELDLRRTIFHETVHDLLLRRRRDSDSVWGANRQDLVVRGSSDDVRLFRELARTYLLAQEELFAYDAEASLYPPPSERRNRYSLWVDFVTRYFLRHHLTFNYHIYTIPVRHRPRRPWFITYRFPTGLLNVTAEDGQSAGMLLQGYRSL